MMSAQSSTLPTLSPHLMVSEYRDWAEVEGLRASWNTLVAQIPDRSVFATPEWLFSWWRAYGGNKQACVLVFSDLQAGIVGIVPLYRQPLKFLGIVSFQLLRLIGDGSGDSDDLDFIVKPGYAGAVTQAFLGWLHRTPWDKCELNCLSSRSQVATLLKDELHASGWKIAICARPLTRVTLPKTWEQYLKQLSSKERGKVGNLLRRLQARHTVRFRRCERSDELPAFLETLYSLHQKRWEAKSEPGSFSIPARRRLYSEMAHALLDRGWLELWQLEMDGVPVASQIALRYEHCLYALQEGFDPAYSTDSVGYVLRSYILREAIASGLRAYDFLQGDQESKQRWGAYRGHYIDLRFARPSSLGAFHLAQEQALDLAKDWLRARAPVKMWNTLRKLRNSLQKHHKTA